MRFVLSAAVLLLVPLAACQQQSGNTVAVTIARADDGSGERSAIQRVLDADAAASAQGQTPFDVYAAMQQIDLTGAPSDFAAAYRTHMDAYREARDLRAEGERMAGATAAQQADWTRRGETNRARINQSFAALASIATAYGATVPRAAVSPDTVTTPIG